MIERNAKGQFLQRQSSEKHEGYSLYYDSKGYKIMHINGMDIRHHIYVWEQYYKRKNQKGSRFIILMKIKGTIESKI